MKSAEGRKKAKPSTGLFSSFPRFWRIYFTIFLLLNPCFSFVPKIIPLFPPHCRLVGDSGTVLRREVRASDHVEPGEPGGDQEPGEEGTVRRGRGGKVGRNLGRRHSRASSLDRREIYQKYIHTDRSDVTITFISSAMSFLRHDRPAYMRFIQLYMIHKAPYRIYSPSLQVQ